MANLNQFIGCGNITRDPEVKFLPSGSAVCNMTLAINRKYKKADQWVEEVAFIPLVVWGKAAESCGEYLKKGSPILVQGRLQSREWEQDGKKRTALEVVADNVQFLSRGEKKKEGDDETPF